jgi:hypothetical protein
MPNVGMDRDRVWVSLGANALAGTKRTSTDPLCSFLRRPAPKWPAASSPTGLRLLTGAGARLTGWGITAYQPVSQHTRTDLTMPGPGAALTACAVMRTAHGE